MVTNDDGGLAPKTDFQGRTLEYDLPALRIGIAEYPEGPTGCTVFLFERDVRCAVDVRGGSPGYVGDYGWVNAICLAGGSLYRLEAVSGVAAELFAACGYSTQWGDIACVSGAIVYDFRARENPAVYPDKDLGRAAARSARSGLFPLGPRGAGANVYVGKGLTFDLAERAGQGGAYRQLGAIKVAVFTVLNAMGAVVNREGHAIRGHLEHGTGERRHLHELLEPTGRSESPPELAQGHTTLTVVVTNARLNDYGLRQLGRQVHSSMARAIQPFHTPHDGDVLFAVTTDEVDSPSRDATSLGTLASEVAWDAVLSADGAE